MKRLHFRQSDFEDAFNFVGILRFRIKMSKEPSFKVVFLGEGRVGKTSIGKRWAENKFDPNTRSTVAAAWFQKTTTTSDGKPVNIQLWDTAGQEEYKSLAPIYYKDSQAAILVYSVVDQGSFEKTVQWRKELVMSRGENIKIVIVANKIDLATERCVSREQGEQYAQSVNAKYFEVSAKTGDGIELLFFHVADLLMSLPQKEREGKRPGRVSLTVVNGEENDAQKKQGGCC